ncbi:MAG TPA: phosphoglycerate dehydrogenase [Polyangiaceae bacterium]|nr:phosphoglycerate dehydrogenase [Polyangiaceae bacterium]
MKRILVSDNLSEQGLDRIRSAEGVELDYRPGLDEPALAEAIKGAHGLVIRSGSRVTSRVIEAADALAVIGRAGIGVDNVDIEAASKRGIVVMNTPTGNAVTTAEHTVSLMMALARWIPRGTATLKAGVWAKKQLKGRELADKTLAVIGLGTIGRIVADRARGLKMKVIGFDPVLTADRAAALGIELVSLDEIWKRADVITVHTPLTPQTKGLIDDDVVDELKDGVLLVNCARGGIYDEQAVLAGLNRGKIGGAAFDVFVEEPPPADHPLIAHDKVVCTPHLGASTVEAQDRVAIQIAEQVVAYLTTGAIKNGLNVPSMSQELADELAPWVTLADRLGGFLAQVEAAEPKSIAIEVVGTPSEHGLDAVSAAAVGGYLRHFLDVPVNAVSAPHLARDRGIAVKEQKTLSPSGPHGSEIVVTVHTAAGVSKVAAGTLGMDRSPRLIRWGSFEIEARLEGKALVVESLDKPGVIGFMGTSLGEAGVNVASVFLGKAPEGYALSMWNLDDELDDAALAKVNASENVRRATVVSF